MLEFVHLHNHTQYSLLDGACRIDKLVPLVKEYGMSAVAITDHGNMAGAIEFYKACQAEGIKPIIGIEAYVAPDKLDRKEVIEDEPRIGYHLVLLAKNNTGYLNLLKMAAVAVRDGFYHKPRIDKGLLKEHADGLICSSACLQGEIAYWLLRGDHQRAEQAALEYRDIFGGDFYIELMNHGIEDEDKTRPQLIKLAGKHQIPLVATNDCHYLSKDDSASHDILVCIQTGKKADDTSRMRYTSDSLHLATPEQMADLFSDTPEAIENTVKIAEQCNVELDLGEMHLPAFPVPENVEVNDYFRQQVREGFKKRNLGKDAHARMQHELKTIEEMGFPGYFLIVADFVQHAKEMGIYVGPGRGSAAGSLVSYCLGITEVNPLDYNLLFERFLNPARVSMPDIDIDFADKDRERVVQYVTDKYGSDSVCQIGTYGTLSARAVIKDVGRALGVNYQELNELSKLIPPGVDLDEAQKIQGLAPIINTELYRHSLVLEGLKRHSSTHAAGVVITPGPLTDFVPLGRGTHGEVVSQYDMNSLEDLGLLKMDFLGLRTLSVIADTIKMIDDNLDINTIPLDDQKTFDIFCSGQTVGVFQFESAGMQAYLQELQPHSIEQLSAMNALHRPGPLEGGVVDAYIARKNGYEDIEYLHPSLEPILSNTYGIMVYQEQAIRIASEVAGFSLSKADIMRKAIGKKKDKLMQSLHEDFVAGCENNGLDVDTAVELWNLIDKFSGYSFNKCVTGDTTVTIVDGVGITSQHRIDGIFLETDSALFNGEIGYGHPLRIVGVDDQYWYTKPTFITDIIQTGAQEVYTITTKSGRSIRATAKHRFWAQRLIDVGPRWFSVKEMIDCLECHTTITIATVDDNALPVEGDIEFEKITSISRPTKEMTYDISVDASNHAFIANGFVSHNSHSVSYALLAYQTAHLKAHYPAEFMSACLTSESSDQDRIRILLADCKKMGLEIFTPDVNHSLVGFAPHDRGVRFGLSAIKGLGDDIAQAVVDNQPYKSMFDLTAKLDPKLYNTKKLEALVDAGAFDWWLPRGVCAGCIEQVNQWGRLVNDLKKFNVLIQPDEPTKLDGELWAMPELLRREYETLGYFVTDHPAKIADRKDSYDTTETFQDKEPDNMATIVAVPTSVNTHIDRKGQTMAFVTAEDEHGSFEAIVFASVYAETKEWLHTGLALVWRGKATRRKAGTGLQMLVNSISLR